MKPGRLPFKGFMDVEYDWINEDILDRDTSHQSLGGGSNSGSNKCDRLESRIQELEGVIHALRADKVELQEKFNAFMETNIIMVEKINSAICFFKIVTTNISNEMIIDLLEGLVRGSVDVEEINVKLDKLKNPVERRLDNIED